MRGKKGRKKLGWLATEAEIEERKNLTKAGCSRKAAGREKGRTSSLETVEEKETKASSRTNETAIKRSSTKGESFRPTASRIRKRKKENGLSKEEARGGGLLIGRITEDTRRKREKLQRKRRFVHFQSGDATTKKKKKKKKNLDSKVKRSSMHHRKRRKKINRERKGEKQG